MIIDHNHPLYRARWRASGTNRYNGAFYYSKEIVKFIIPRVKTDRNWITINTRGVGLNHAIVFIHNNLHPEYYKWLKRYGDLVLVCGVPETCEKMKELGKTIYLPLSVDVESVAQYKRPKTKETAFAGRASKRCGVKDCDYLMGLKRQELLPAMAEYKNIYAVGRTAIEAKILGCNVLPYDPRFPDPDVWEVLDCAEAAKMLQKELDKIDGKDNGTK